MLLMLVLLCGLTACGDKTEQSADPVAYTLTVQTEGGMPLADVRVDVFRADDLSDRVWAGMTDADGVVTFKTAQTALVAKVSELADCYKPQDTYTVDAAEMTIAIPMTLYTGDDASRTFGLGDAMMDFTLGSAYGLSDLLETKKAVVLNFWFEGCGPCRAEFPYLQKAYDKYAEKLEVLAINPYDGTDDSVAAYAQALDLTFPMIKGDMAWNAAMNLTAFPTTVVIDRYGMIAFIHKGAITEEGVFEAIFAYFTSDDYVQGTVRNLSDLT